MRASAVRTLGRPTVLVIEDETRIASFVMRAIGAQGFSVERAADGESGLEKALGGNYSIVVLDLLLPGIDGVEVLDRLIEARPEQRVLVLSALSEVETRVLCLERGAVDYVTKPFSVAELCARIRTRLREPARAPSDRIVQVGPLRLDLVRRVAEVGDRRVSLTERESALLHHLMALDGEVATREELLQSVWRVSHDPGSNVVEVFVGRVRAKLGDDLIETVRGTGYRLDVS